MAAVAVGQEANSDYGKKHFINVLLTVDSAAARESAEGH